MVDAVVLTKSASCDSWGGTNKRFVFLSARSSPARSLISDGHGGMTLRKGVPSRRFPTPGPKNPGGVI